MIISQTGINFCKKKKSNRIKYLESELAAKDRLDGYVLAGFIEELKILKNEKDN